MYTRILVPLDGSALSDKATGAAIELARALSARIIAFYAAPAGPTAVFSEGAEFTGYASREVFQKMRDAFGSQLLEQATRKAAAAGVSAEGRMAVSDAPSEAILAAAAEAGCDLIVMASHGRRGMSALLLGSETQKVLAHSQIPVLVIR
jgi:nucleotide-binding universal stress UspA family protein